MDPLDLVVVAVDERHPGALMVGVAAVGLVEDLGDYRRGVIDNACGQPFVVCDGPWFGGSALGVGGGQDVQGCSRRGCCVVEGANLGQSFTVALLALGQAGGQLGRGLGRRPLGRGA